MKRFKLVSGPVPACSLPTHALDTLTVVFHGSSEELRRKFPRKDFPRVTGIGHLVNSPAGSEPFTHYLTLIEEGENGWVTARTDPR